MQARWAAQHVGFTFEPERIRPSTGNAPAIYARPFQTHVVKVCSSGHEWSMMSVAGGGSSIGPLAVFETAPGTFPGKATRPGRSLLSVWVRCPNYFGSLYAAPSLQPDFKFP